jgi:hypothetical protein
MDSLYLVHSSYFSKSIEVVVPLVKPQITFRHVLTQKVPRASIIP